ncbi:DNA-directed RNA polymerase subunit beta' [Madurella mycetomatis]|uniref:DNA-directed RNA polymerase subunit beta n=1 Tax=Madurella mycetomatis TaxID=100816 RepID=A0A175VPF0_9PEZI|nr:DNA-directed RNA polymerase subunit beta' [Madurella mycetomatis]KXX80295.1 DNA-directed RNA polymerase subunit beta' [Madurella mycetomatis]
MQFSTIFVVAFAGLASAGPALKRQNDCPEVDDIPLCGYPCILAAASDIGCAADDYSCMCGQFDELRLAAASCTIENCGIEGVQAVLDAAEAVCAACA